MVYVIGRDDYLAHHGILGMKWGKRQGPPYPLDGKQHSAAEKKAGWQKSLDKASSKVSADIESGKQRGSTARAVKKALNKTDDAVTRAIYDKQVNENLKLKKLTKNPNADVSKFDKRIANNQKIIEEGEKRTWQLMATSAVGGYSINSQKTLKYVDKGQMAGIMSSTIMFGVVGGAASMAGYAALDAVSRKQTGVRKEVEGNKFDVKKSKGDNLGFLGNLHLDTGRAKGAEQVDAYNKAARERFLEEKRLADERRKMSKKSSEMKLKDKPATTQAEKDRAMINEAKANSKTLSSQVSKELTKDLIRWNKQGKDNYMKGKNAADVQKALEKEINEKIIKTANGPYMFGNKATTGKPTVKFQIDGLKNYSGGAPLEIEFDPQTKKVTYIGYV